MKLSKLSNQIENTFILDEIRDLCHKIGINFENINKGNLNSTVIKFVEYLSRRGQIPSLIDILEKERDHIDWKGVVNIAKYQSDTDSYQREVQLEISLACHRWKNEYLSLYFTKQANDPKYQDIWEALLETSKYNYSIDVWESQKHLFGELMEKTTQRLEFICAFYGDGIHNQLKAAIIREVRMLRAQQAVYRITPELIAAAVFPPTNEEQNEIFSAPFQATLKSLTSIARQAEKEYLS